MLDFSDRTRTGISKLISRCAQVSVRTDEQEPGAESPDPERCSEKTPLKKGVVPYLQEDKFSTPTCRGQFEHFSPPVSSDNGSDSTDSDESFQYLNNMRVALNRINCSDDSSDFGNNDDRISANPRVSKWKNIPQSVKKYVDNLTAIEKLCVNAGIITISQRKQSIDLHAVQCESFFKVVRENAAKIGLTVNGKKTQVLCIQTSTTSDIRCYINDSESHPIMSQPTLKILGFHFNQDPTVNAQIEHIKSKARRRFWVIRHLKAAGMSSDDLLQMYKCYVLSVIDYSAVVYHSMITREQSAALEGLQMACLRIIYGTKKSYGRILSELEGKLTTIAERRQALVDKFIIKTVANPNYKDRWFPRRAIVDHNLRRDIYYKEEFAKSQHLYNAPLFYYRRRLNEISKPEKDDDAPLEY